MDDDWDFCFLEEEELATALATRGCAIDTALATLPLRGAVTGAFSATEGLGGATATGLTDAGAGVAAAGLAVPTAFAGFWTTAGLVTAGVCLAVLTGALGAGAFLAGALAAAGLLATFLAGTAFFAGVFFTAAFLTVLFFAAAGLAAAFFGAVFGVAFLTAFTAFFATAFATALPVPRAAVAAGLALPGLADFAEAAGLFFCAFLAVELRVVFAISLHRFGRGGRVL